LPQNFKTFDFYDDATGLATSAKTLNTLTPLRIAEPDRIYSALKSHIDATVRFDNYELSSAILTRSIISSRELRVAVPQGTSFSQWQQIQRAIEYGKGLTSPVKVYVTTTR